MSNGVCIGSGIGKSGVQVLFDGVLLQKLCAIIVMPLSEWWYKSSQCGHSPVRIEKKWASRRRTGGSVGTDNISDVIDRFNCLYTTSKRIRRPKPGNHCQLIRRYKRRRWFISGGISDFSGKSIDCIERGLCCCCCCWVVITRGS